MKSVIFAALLLFLFSSCKDEIVSSDTDRNLIKNPSFEMGENPSLDGWVVQGTTKFYEDPSPGGGKYSVGINADMGPAGYVAATVPTVKDKKIYVFNCWAKMGSLPGKIDFAIQRDSLIIKKSVEVKDTTWAYYTIIDTAEYSDADSIKIFLRGSISQLLPSVTYYDNCKLEANN